LCEIALYKFILTFDILPIKSGLTWPNRIQSASDSYLLLLQNTSQIYQQYSSVMVAVIVM